MTIEERRRAIIANIGGPDPATMTPAVLQQIASGPIMDPCRIFLPAGRLSMAEAAARESRIRAGAAS